MNAFDPIKALKEEISGIVDCRMVFVKRERQLQQQHGELEVELNHVTKMRGFVDAELDRKRAVLKSLENGEPYTVSKVFGDKAVLTPKGQDWVDGNVQNLQISSEGLKEGDTVMVPR